jgi:cobalt-zinc-cadmium efflux system protein
MPFLHSNASHGHPHPGSAAGNGGGSQGGGDPLRRLRWVLALTIAFMGVEAAGGWLSGSLALLADAGHMLSDASALGLALLAAWLAGRAVSPRHTFGFRRAEFLAAFVNALGLVMLAVWIVAEAVGRMGTPRPVQGGLMLLVALGGLDVNLAGLLLLRGQGAGNINLRSAMWHLTGDLLGSLGAVAAGAVIHFTGWTPIDPLLGIAIAVLIGLAGGRILYDSATLLMDRVPREIDTAAVRGFLASHPDVRRICDLHIWGVSSSESLLTAHLVVGPSVDRDDLLGRLLPALQQRFGLAHLTVQLESRSHASCPEEW